MSSDVRRGGAPDEPLLDPGQVEILGAGVRPRPATANTTWPCPFCGQRHPVADAVTLHIRNSTPPFLARDVLACQVCASRLLRRPGADGNGR